MENTRRSQALLLLLLVLFIWASCCGSTHARPNGRQLQVEYLRATGAYRRLQRILPAQELRALIGLGLLNGARQAEEQMEQHLVQEIKELLQQSATEQSDKILPKVDAIEQQMERDQHALNILSSAMDLLSNDKDEQQFRQELHIVLKDQQQQQHQQQQHQHQHQQQNRLEPSAGQAQVGERVGQLRQHILQQVPQMKTELDTKIERALKHLIKHATAGGPLAMASEKVLHKRAANEKTPPENPKRDPEQLHPVKSILSEDDFRDNLLDQQFEKTGDSSKETQPKNEFDELDKDSQNVTAMSKPKDNANQEAVDSSAELGGDDDDDGPGGGAGGGGGGGGGLVGIIGSLSGGEGGSDVGALIGALTGVISTLFGPGGLDIEALISTATSLLSGLLSGNRNFGVVLGNYVGTAFDGLSGGGGAINNGQFLGNFVGTVLAALSADPEDEGPPQPLTFTKNFFTGFIESKFRPVEEPEERHGSGERPRQKQKESHGSGFDSGGFVKQITAHLVSNALGLLLNASLGASGGASSASTGLFSSSSSGHHMKSAISRSWTQT